MKPRQRLSSLSAVLLHSTSFKNVFIIIIFLYSTRFLLLILLTQPNFFSCLNIFLLDELQINANYQCNHTNDGEHNEQRHNKFKPDL